MNNANNTAAAQMNTALFGGYNPRDFAAYAEEAQYLTLTAQHAALVAQETLSRADLQAALVALSDAAAMHQRAGNSAGAGNNKAAFEHHTAIWGRINAERGALRKVRPTCK